MKVTKQQIRAAREALGFSQADFGAKLKLTGSAISLLETGETSPIDVDEESPVFPLWKALLSGDRDAIAKLPSPLAAWLRASRIKKKLTVAKLSEMSNVAEHTIGALERAQTVPPVSVLRRLEDAVGEAYPVTEQTPRPSAPIAGVGTLQDFDPHNLDDRPICAGIYVLYDISDRPIYVGESKNIRQRLKQHEEKFWFKRPLVEYGAYISVTDNELRKGMEQILIGFLRSNAVLNRQHVFRS